MRKGLLLVVALVSISAHVLSAATLPPCDANSSSDPVEPLQPVPASGIFQCGEMIFDDFSSNILNGGLIGASYSECGAGGFTHLGCTLLEVQPASPALGWSYRATGRTAGFGGLVNWLALPALNHVSSGAPTVTEHFCTSSPCTNDDVLGRPLTADAHTGTGFVETRNASGLLFVYVQVNPSDITGGTISALDTIFVTPEPASTLIVGSGLAALIAYLLSRRCRRQPES